MRRWNNAPLVLFLLFLSTLSNASVSEPSALDVGFFANRSTDLEGRHSLKVLGPLYEDSIDTHKKSLRALRPFYSSVKDSGEERELQEFLWPLGSSKRFKNQFSLRLLTALYFDEDVNNPESRYRTWLLPFYFEGRDANKQTYTALFPLAGKIHEFLGRDKIDFFLFPLYAHHSINDVETWDYLWPLISRTKGKGIYRFRFFPFYSQTKHRDRSETKFVMWPIWTWKKFKLDRSSGTGYILFPFYGRLKLTDQESWMILPPLFRFHRGERLNQVYAPWPFIQYSKGEIEKFYIWPLFGRKQSPGIQSSFLLWPLFWREKRDRGDIVSRRFMALPFFHADTHKTRATGPNDEEKVTMVYRKLWPLGSYHREKKKKTLKILDVWPLKDNGPIARNFAPFWTLYTRTSTETAKESEGLWGLYRYQQEGKKYSRRSLFPLFSWMSDQRKERRKRLSLLFGLIQIESNTQQKSYRLLYFLKFNQTWIRQLNVGFLWECFGGKRLQKNAGVPAGCVEAFL